MSKKKKVNVNQLSIADLKLMLTRGGKQRLVAMNELIKRGVGIA